MSHQPDSGAQVAASRPAHGPRRRLRGLLCLTPHPRPARVLHRAVTLLVILTWLLEPLAPVAALYRQPQRGAQSPGAPGP